MDSATFLMVSIGVITLGITILSVYTAFGPNAKDLEDPMMNHTHGTGPGSHTHSFSFGNGHNHDHDHAHDHSHSHAPAAESKGQAVAPQKVKS
ncbi:MAG: photosystem II protein N [Cyanobacteria bacterium J06621_8]